MEQRCGICGAKSHVARINGWCSSCVRTLGHRWGDDPTAIPPEIKKAAERRRARIRANSANTYWRETRRVKPRVYSHNHIVSHFMGKSIRRHIGRQALLKRRWTELVPYTADELRRHLEGQFAKGMSWQNYGTDWHIDHIVPIAAFSFETPECRGFKKCWAITNLRPLWAKANYKKRATIE